MTNPASELLPKQDNLQSLDSERDPEIWFQTEVRACASVGYVVYGGGGDGRVAKIFRRRDGRSEAPPT